MEIKMTESGINFNKWQYEDIKKYLGDIYKDADGVLYTKDMKTLVAFPNGYEAEQYIIPNEVEVLADYAFYNKRKIKKLVISDNIKTIGKYALFDTSIEEIVLPITIDYIGDWVIYCTDIKKVKLVNNLNVELQKLPKVASVKPKVKIVADENILKSLRRPLMMKQDIDAFWATIIKSDDPTEMAYVLLFQKTKAWESWLDQYGSRAAEIVSKALEVLKEEKKISANAAKRLTAFARKYVDKIAPEILNKMIALLKEKGQEKTAVNFENSAEIKAVISGGSVHPIEEYVNVHINKKESKEFEKEIKNGIKYTDGSGISSVNALILIVSQYMQQWKKYKVNYLGSMGNTVEALSEGWKLKKDPTADYVAEALDRKELTSFLKEQAYGAHYRKYIIAFARYANQEEITEFIKLMESRKKGKGKEKWWAQTAENALYLSDCMAAAAYMDAHKQLSRYAHMRESDENDYKQRLLVGDLGFDENGIISFDIGNNIIELSITPEAEIQLYDRAQKKVIKNFPQKSEDANKLAKSRERFNALRNDIKEFKEKRIEYLRSLYLSGESIPCKFWLKTYPVHPILKVLARLLIWKDASRQFFVLTDDGIVDVAGRSYMPNGDVRLAHILDMKEQDVENWRSFLAERKQEPLFTPVWESDVITGLFTPVWESGVITGVTRLRKRYNGAVISNKERNAFKKAMKSYGIIVKSASQEGVFNASTGRYKFSNNGKMLIGEKVTLNYEVDGVTKDLTLGRFEEGQEDERVLNTVINELDQACERTKLEKEERIKNCVGQFDSYNLAQYDEFLNHKVIRNAKKYKAMVIAEKKQG